MCETKNSAKGAKVKNSLAKVVAMASMLGTAIMANPAVFAGDYGAGAKLTSILEKLCPVVAVIGVPIALIGGFKLIMAFRNDQGDAVPAAARDLAIGIFLTAFATLGPAIISGLGT